MLPFADTDEEFVLDLQGVSDLPSLFFNMCLKRFVDDRGAEFVKSRVRFKNISRSQAARVGGLFGEGFQTITSPQSEYTTSDCCRQSLRRARRKGSPPSLPAAGDEDNTH